LARTLNIGVISSGICGGVGGGGSVVVVVLWWWWFCGGGGGSVVVVLWWWWWFCGGSSVVVVVTPRLMVRNGCLVNIIISHVSLIYRIIFRYIKLRKKTNH
jgi:hypothetical protein